MAAAEHRRLELRVRLVERRVVPVEPSAQLGRPNEQRLHHAREQSVVVGRTRARVRTREDRGGVLALQLLDGDSRVLVPRELVRTRLHERAHERPVLVQRRTVERGVLLERER